MEGGLNSGLETAGQWEMMRFLYRVAELMDYEVVEVMCSVMEEGRDCGVV